MTQADAMEFFSHCMQLDSQVAERQRIAAEIQDGFTHRLALVSKKIGKLGRHTGACGHGALNNMETYLRSLKDLLGRAAVTSEDVLSDSQKLTFACTTIIPAVFAAPTLGNSNKGAVRQAPGSQTFAASCPTGLRNLSLVHMPVAQPPLPY